MNHPNDWKNLIKWAGKGNFNVIEMNQNLIFDFNYLLKSKYQMKKKNEKGDVFIFKNVKWLRYTKDNINLVQYKNSLKIEDTFQELNMKRRKPGNTLLPLAYNQAVPITEEKKKDIVSILGLIPEVFHEFYLNLKTKEGLTDPIVSSEDESD